MKKLVLAIGVALIVCILAGTDVSGTQAGLWELADSPFNIVGDVTIPAGLSLHIDPGVVVNAMGNFRITAQGQLYAAGSDGDSIRFQSGMADPNALWKGIRLESTTQGSQIGFCYIEKAEYGINSVNSPALIHHNRLYKNQRGMQIYGIGAADPAQVVVSTNIIEWSAQNGIFVVQNSNAVILGNELRFNGTGTQYYAAIQLSNQSAGGSCSPEITGNHIHHNFKQGITAWDITASGAIAPHISENIIENNLTGIYLLNSSGFVYDNYIRNNYIQGDMNSGAGAMVAGTTSAPYFKQNEIYGNYTGFYLGTNANPCLGNSSIDNIWAIGENHIHDNIDANGVSHSIYCYSYTNSTITIYAEDNYWGTNDTAEIATGIQDHIDDAALPTVDFDPFLTETLPTSVIGSMSYLGGQNLHNFRLQIVTADGGEIVEEFPFASLQDFSIQVTTTETFHVVILADVENMDMTLYGCAGGFSNPTVFAPGDLVPVNVGQILVQDALPPRYQEIGAPEVDGAHTIYPVYNTFFVYHWQYINWLYQEGVNIYIKRVTWYSDLENTIFNFPDGTVWDRIGGFFNGDTWTRTEIMDENGTQRHSLFTYRYVTEDAPVQGKDPYRNFYDLFIQRDVVGDSLISTRLISGDVRKLFHYRDGYVWRSEDITPNIAGNYLAEGNSWDFVPPLPYYQPVYLNLDPMEHYGLNVHYLTLFWQAPMDDGFFNWTSYRIYNYDQLFAEVPFGQNFWHTEDLPYDSYNFTVAAWDGTNASGLTNSVLIIQTAADDPEAVPVTLSVQPNPVSLGHNGHLQLILKGGKGISGKVDIFNIRGQRVRTLPITGTDAWRGDWNLLDSKGSPCGSGIYFLRLQTSGGDQIDKKVALIR
jgi:parallel beta-helix repeat protein